MFFLQPAAILSRSHGSTFLCLQPSGRFEVEKKICLTISSHHEETWRPSWTIRTVLLALISFMPSRGDGAIASLDWPSEERKKLAKKSLGFMCDKCGSHNMTALPPEDVNETVSANDIPQELELRDAKSKPAQPASATPTSPLADSGSFPASSLRDSAAGVVGAPEQTSPASPPSTQTADHSHSPTPTAALATPYVEPQPMQHLPAMQQAAPLQQQYVVPNLAPLPPPVQTALFDDDDASDAKPQLSSYLDILITVLGVLMATVVLAKVVVSSISL
jgi:hypothetical protein